MLGRHGRDPHPRLLLGTALHLNQHLLEGIQLEHARERLRRALGSEAATGMRRGDDGEIASQGRFDFVVEVITAVK